MSVALQTSVLLDILVVVNVWPAGANRGLQPTDPAAYRSDLTDRWHQRHGQLPCIWWTVQCDRSGMLGSWWPLRWDQRKWSCVSPVLCSSKSSNWWEPNKKLPSLCNLSFLWIKIQLVSPMFILYSFSTAQSLVWCFFVQNLVSLIGGRAPVEGIFPLQWTWVLASFSKTLSDKSMNQALVCTHAFHRTDSKVPDIQVLDRWMPAAKTHPARTIHEDGMSQPLWRD